MHMHGHTMLTLSPQLRSALRDYSRAANDVAAVGARQDEGRKRALVLSRRQLSEHVGILSTAIEKDEVLAKSPGEQQELNRLFATMRYALALHQADWPAVSIDDDPLAYRESSLRVREKSSAFWDWCRINLGLERDRIGA
jgi:hypothetical protein